MFQRKKRIIVVVLLGINFVILLIIYGKLEKYIANTDLAAEQNREISEALAEAEHIFRVTISSRKIDNMQSTETCKCYVWEDFLAKPPQERQIMIEFLCDSVEVGSDYVVLVREAEEGSSIYPLVTPNCVYFWEEAKRLPELKELLFQSRIETENTEAWVLLSEFMPETSLDTVKRIELSYMSCFKEFQKTISKPEELDETINSLKSMLIRPTTVEWEEVRDYAGEESVSFRIVYQDGTEWIMEKYSVIWLNGEKEQLYEVSGTAVWEMFLEKCMEFEE